MHVHVAGAVEFGRELVEAPKVGIRDLNAYPLAHYLDRYVRV